MSTLSIILIICFTLTPIIAYQYILLNNERFIKESLQVQINNSTRELSKIAAKTLKPCPVCGSLDSLYYDYINLIVGCRNCKLNTTNFKVWDSILRQSDLDSLTLKCNSYELALKDLFEQLDLTELGGASLSTKKESLSIPTIPGNLHLTMDSNTINIYKELTNHGNV